MTGICGMFLVIGLAASKTIITGMISPLGCEHVGTKLKLFRDTFSTRCWLPRRCLQPGWEAQARKKNLRIPNPGIHLSWASAYPNGPGDGRTKTLSLPYQMDLLRPASSKKTTEGSRLGFELADKY